MTMAMICIISDEVTQASDCNNVGKLLPAAATTRRALPVQTASIAVDASTYGWASVDGGGGDSQHNQARRWGIWDAEHHTDIQRKEAEAVIWMSLWHTPTRAHEEAINSDDTTDV